MELFAGLAQGRDGRGSIEQFQSRQHEKGAGHFCAGMTMREGRDVVNEADVAGYYLSTVMCVDIESDRYHAHEGTVAIVLLGDAAGLQGWRTLTIAVQGGFCGTANAKSVSGGCIGTLERPMTEILHERVKVYIIRAGDAFHSGQGETGII